MSRRREKELRCFCRHEPLLATYGLDRKDKLFVHVKIWKAKRIFGELVIEGGVVKIRCRDCLRWHVIRINGTSANLEETREQMPTAIIEDGR